MLTVDTGDGPREVRAPDPIGPMSVPALAAMLQDHARDARYAQYIAHYLSAAHPDRMHEQVREARRLFNDDPTAEEMAAANAVTLADDVANGLNIATLFHVTDPMLQVSILAAEKLDEFDRWQPDTWPSPVGLMVFETPVLISDVWNRIISYGALMWKREYVQPDIARTVGSHGGWYTKVIMFSDTQDGRDQYVMLDPAMTQIRHELGRWILANIGGVADGSPVGPLHTADAEQRAAQYRARVPDEIAELAPSLAYLNDPAVLYPNEVLANDINFYRVLFTILTLMNTPMADVDEVIDRRSARRWRNRKRPPAQVSVINLRRKEDHGYHEEGTGRWLTYRSMTRGHWRRQPCGPGKSETKLIYIHPYMRGPENAPLYQPKRVNTFRR